MNTPAQQPGPQLASSNSAPTNVIRGLPTSKNDGSGCSKRATTVKQSDNNHATGALQMVDVKSKNFCQPDGNNKPNGSGGKITRFQCLNNAKPWIDKRMLYSQSQYDSGYRTDCSGFVSKAWGLKESKTTATLMQFSKIIRWE